MANSPLNSSPDDENTPLNPPNPGAPRGEEFDFDAYNKTQSPKNSFWKQWGGWSILIGAFLVYGFYSLAMSRNDSLSPGAVSPFLTQNATPVPEQNMAVRATEIPTPAMQPTPALMVEPSETPVVTETPSVSAEPAANKSSEAALAQLKTHPVNINTASLQELLRLPEVGEKTAGYIVAYRTQNGPFQAVDDLDKVQGIGVKRLEMLRPLVVVR